jgi:acetoin utilization deacetylase AcuC-like enzyme
MRKFGHLADLLRRDAISPGLRWHDATPIEMSALMRTHTASYVEAVLTQTLDAKLERRIGFPVTQAVAERSLLAVGGTRLAADLALAHGLAANTAGGSHHADREGGAGFCVFNDVAVAALDLLQARRVERILVVDCDVHQGDGTARLFATDPRVFTLSIHCEANWPREKPPSDLDVDLPKGAGDEAYLDAMRPALRQAVERSRPDLVFYNAGVDPHADDRLGLLSLSDDGLRARDALAVETCRRFGLPLAAVLGGGYGPDPRAVARRHLILFETLAASAT